MCVRIEAWCGWAPAQDLMGLNPLEPMFLAQVHAVLCDHRTEVHVPGTVLSAAYMSAHLVNDSSKTWEVA